MHALGCQALSCASPVGLTNLFLAALPNLQPAKGPHQAAISGDSASMFLLRIPFSCFSPRQIGRTQNVV